jgi:hypothetical protein
MDLTAKSDEGLNQMIANYEDRAGGTALPLYKQLLEERARRSQASQRLNLDRTLEHLKDAAFRQVCTTYGNVAKASGVAWTQARRQMDGANGHLNRVADLCHARGLPFLTALCVNQNDVEAGELKGEALAGFVACARRLGFFVADEQAFHREQRDTCWRWGLKVSQP